MTKMKKYTEIGYVSLFVWAVLFVTYITPNQSLYNAIPPSLLYAFLYMVTGLITILVFEQAHKMKETQANTIGLIISVVVLVITVIGLFPSPN